MENNDAQFWWDIPEFSGKEKNEEIQSRRYRPDGKIIFGRNGKMFAFLIEMTVPWTENRGEKQDLKDNKYVDIMSNMKLDYPNHEVDQITLVMDVFGGYGTELRRNIGKVIDCRITQDSVIKNMQKSVISSVSNISRVFKVRTK